MSTPDLETLLKENRETWDQIAAFWDDFMGPEGGDFQRFLLGPPTEQLLDLQPAEQVLDIGCGNGIFARRMAHLGAHVTATDISRVFIERAQAHTKEHADRITYQVLDATDEPALLALGPNRFDAAVATMAVMDIPNPLTRTIPHLIKPGGRFVFSVMHPCFNNSHCRHLVEEEDDDGDIKVTYSIKVTGYMTPASQRGIGVRGQPVPHRMFHRPLHQLLGVFLSQGLVLDALVERSFQGEAQPGRPFAWANYHDIPPVLIVRLRRPREA